MKNLLISGETTDLKTWDIDEILPRQRSTKDEFERMMYNDKLIREERRLIYENFYLNLELDKCI